MARATLIVAGFLIIVASGLMGFSSFATALGGGHLEAGTLFLASCGLFLVGLCLAIYGVFAPSELERAQLDSMQYEVAPMYQTPSHVQQTFVQEREIVKVRCRNCGSLNLETANACAACGAPM